MSEQKTLWLDPDAPLRDGLASAFAEIVGHALAMARLVEGEPERAVHDYRRSIRRAQAQLDLTAGQLRGRARSWVEDSLRRAFAKTSKLRDHGVLIPTLEQARGALSVPGAAERISELLLEARDQVKQGRARRVLTKRARALAGLGPIYEAGLEGSTAWPALRARLLETWEEARGRFLKTRRSGRARDAHEWRKAAKRLRYQLEVFAARGEGALEALQADAAAQAKQLGAITDLMALRAFVQRSADRLEDLGPGQLVADLEGLIAPRIALALKSAETFYRDVPEAIQDPEATPEAKARRQHDKALRAERKAAARAAEEVARLARRAAAKQASREAKRRRRDAKAAKKAAAARAKAARKAASAEAAAARDAQRPEGADDGAKRAARAEAKAAKAAARERKALARSEAKAARQAAEEREEAASGEAKAKGKVPKGRRGADGAAKERAKTAPRTAGEAAEAAGPADAAVGGEAQGRDGSRVGEDRGADVSAAQPTEALPPASTTPAAAESAPGGPPHAAPTTGGRRRRPKPPAVED